MAGDIVAIRLNSEGKSGLASKNDVIIRLELGNKSLCRDLPSFEYRMRFEEMPAPTDSDGGEREVLYAGEIFEGKYFLTDKPKPCYLCKPLCLIPNKMNVQGFW